MSIKMRRSRQEITDMKVIEKLLAESAVCRLGMITSQGPYIVPLNYFYKNGFLYFHSAPKGRKIQALSEHPEVCVEVDTYEGIIRGANPCKHDTRYRSVIALGRAEPVSDPEEKKTALAGIITKYAEEKEAFPEENIKTVAVYRVRFSQISGKQSSVY